MDRNEELYNFLWAHMEEEKVTADEWFVLSNRIHCNVLGTVMFKELTDQLEEKLEEAHETTHRKAH